MTRWLTGPRALRAAAAVLLVVLGLSSCTGGSSTDPPVHAASAAVVRYVALGGDDAIGRRNRLTSSWPQQLFRTGLPVNAVFVNLANPRSGAAEIRDEQLADAVRLKPDVVTITVQDDLERDTPTAQIQDDLATIVRTLSESGTTVLVGTAPPAAGAAQRRVEFDAAVTAATRAAGAVLVDLGGVDGPTGEARAEQIATAFRQRLDGNLPDARGGTTSGRR